MGLAWRTEFQKASAVWPESVRPDAVGDGARNHDRQASMPGFQEIFLNAKIAALAFSVSKTVSIRMMSAPPSTSPARGLVIVLDQFVEGHITKRRIVHIGRDGAGA
jgi:hypothetical protein